MPKWTRKLLYQISIALLCGPEASRVEALSYNAPDYEAVGLSDNIYIRPYFFSLFNQSPNILPC